QRDTRQQFIAVAEMTIGCGGADAGIARRFGKGEPARSLLRNQFERRFHQRFLEIAVMIATAAARMFAPIHVNSSYMIVSGPSSLPSCVITRPAPDRPSSRGARPSE